MASDFAFIPVEQQSLEGKVHKIGRLLFGWYDPTCKNLKYELAKTRTQILADGYSMRELQRRTRQHHCN